MKSADPNAAPSEALAEAWGRYGLALVGVRNYQAAVEALETAVRGLGNSDGLYDLLMGLGDALLQLGRNEQASEVFFQAAWNLDKGNVDIEDGSVALDRAHLAGNRQEGVLPAPLGSWEPRVDQLDWMALGSAYGEVYVDARAVERFAELLPHDAVSAVHAWHSLSETYKRHVFERWRKLLTPAAGADSAAHARGLDTIDAGGRLRGLAIATLERAVALYAEDRDWEFYQLPPFTELAEELHVLCVLNQEAERAAAWARRLFDVMRQRRESAAGRNDSKYVLVGDVHYARVVDIDSHHVVVATSSGLKARIAVEEFKSDKDEVEVKTDDSVEIAIDVIETVAEVLEVDSAHVGFMIGRGRIMSYMSIKNFKNEQGGVWAKVGDRIQVSIGQDYDSPIFVHKDTEGLQLRFRRIA